MSYIGERLREERERLGLSQSAFGAIGGVLKQAQFNYEKGDRFPDAAYLEAVHKAGVDIQYVISGERARVLADAGSPPEPAPGNVDKNSKHALLLQPVVCWDNEDELDPNVYVFLPILDIKLSAGNGNVVWEVSQKVQRQAFLRTWVERVGVDPDSAAIMTADGSSMEPRIMDGDSLVVDYERTYINEGKIYALALDGEVFVKRIHKEIDGALRISSDNMDKGKYPDKLIPANLVNQVQIIGRVMAVSGGV